MSVLSSERIARLAHAGQKDKAGLPYTGHLGRVAARAVAHAEALSDHHDLAAFAHSTGWLHDILEDTETTADDLRALSVPPLVIAAVERLTKPEDVTYLDYVRGIIASGDPIAMIVKLADNEDNLDPSRPSTSHLTRSLEERYARSRNLLTKALAQAMEARQGEGEDFVGDDSASPNGVRP